VEHLFSRLADLEMRDGENAEPVPGVVLLVPEAWEVFKEVSGDLQD